MWANATHANQGSRVTSATTSLAACHPGSALVMQSAS